MSNDLMIIEELEKEIGPLIQLDSISLDGSLFPGSYSIDDRGYVVGVSFHHATNLNRLPQILLKFNYLKTLGLIRVSIHDFSMLDKLNNLVSLIIRGIPNVDISFLQNMRNLTTLDLRFNQLTDISFLQGLSQLTTLSLGGNHLTDISAFQGLHSLKELYLEDNQLTDISALQGLSNLTTLNLFSNSLTEISALQGLNRLTTLNLFSNQLTDISALQGLSHIKELYLGGNHLTDISAFRGLSRLTTLNLSHNELTDISALQGLSRLTTLNLSHNELTDISALQGLNHLKELYLMNNRLTDISALQGLTKLTRLDLRKNQIKQLPEALMNLGMEIYMDGWHDKGILLDGNPLETPPPEIIRKGKDAIKAYFRSLEFGKMLPLNEVKVILVGDGGAGKTSLVKRLVGKPFDENEPKTHGINIDRWEVKHQKSTIKINTWDFGGQEIMHATHQFFLSKRSLYILVLDGRKDEKTEYWLKHIRSFGGQSPVLVVLNKIDQHPSFELNRRFLQEKYNNIKGFFRLSCADNTGIKEFSRALKRALYDVEIIRTTWAQNWFHVKRQLEEMKDPFISLDRYRDICEKEKISEPSGQDTLVDFLHDLGVILHFDDLGLQDVHVLEPKWVVEAVYKIINSPIAAQSKGILDPAFLSEILKQQKKKDYYYPPDKYYYIIELMRKFELCYRLENGHVLIPDLLAVEQPEFEFDHRDSLKFIFEYDFLPRSVMPRFIVRMHNDIKDCCRWRTGVLLENKAFGAAAVVKADEEAKKIYIDVTGKQKQYYFAVIRHTFKDINRGFEKLDVKEHVAIPDNPEITADYSYLLQLREMNQKEYIPVGIKRPYSIDRLLQGFEENENSRIAVNIKKRWDVLDEFDRLIFKDDTPEAEVHRLLENNLWVLGNDYPKISSNNTLKNILENYFGEKYTGKKAAKRPDLLLAGDMAGKYMLIELKRPGHELNRDDEFQAIKYRDDINRQIPEAKIDILLIGGGISKDISLHNMNPTVKFLSFKGISDSSRKNLQWLIDELSK